MTLCKRPPVAHAPEAGAAARETAAATSTVLLPPQTTTANTTGDLSIILAVRSRPPDNKGKKKCIFYTNREKIPFTHVRT